MRKVFFFVVVSLVVAGLANVSVTSAQEKKHSFERYCVLHSEVEALAKHFQDLGVSEGKMYVLKTHEEIALKAMESMMDQITHIYFIVNDENECGSDTLLQIMPKSDTQSFR